MKKLFLLFLVFLWVVSVKAERRQLVLHSAHIAQSDTVWVFTPSDYTSSPDRTYPVVYLLHGWSGNYHQWDDIMNCQQHADQYGFILVCPDGLYDSWYLNSPAIKNSQYEDFFFQDLVPEIGKKFRINKDNVFITGLSMGGHGALYLFSKHPELFRAAGSLSGVVDLRNCPEDYEIPKYLGLTHTGKDKDILYSFSAIGNIDRIKAAGKEIIFSCGMYDRFLGINNEFKAACDKAGINSVYITSQGGHDYPYWRGSIDFQLLFFSLRCAR